jgi:hypothetical protein
MAFPPGLVLTDRDHLLLRYLALGRFLTASQLAALIQHEGDVWLLTKRLKRLAAPRVGDALVRAASLGDRTFWGLTSSGWELSVAEVPNASPPPLKFPEDASLRHQGLVNDVLVAVLRSIEHRPNAPLTRLPFCWSTDIDERLLFKHHDRNGLLVRAVLKPNAIIAIPGAGRRVFLEIESGARYIGWTAAGLRNTDALVRKLSRYAAFFTAFANAGSPASWYTSRFRDALVPEVLMVVHSVQRREAGRRVLESWLGRTSRTFQVRIVTLDDAAPTLASLVKGTPVPSNRVLTIAESAAVRILNRVNDLLVLVNQHRDVIEAHNRLAVNGARVQMPALPMDVRNELVDLIQHDLLGERRSESAVGLLANRTLDDDVPAPEMTRYCRRAAALGPGARERCGVERKPTDSSPRARLGPREG